MIRVGQGYDVHAFEEEGGALVLAGVEIPNSRGLKGHSDADVLLHAITDALLGALAWGDIGQWFPDTDEKYRGADSKELLDLVWKRVVEKGWRLVNVDSVVIAEEPKLSLHREAMIASIAAIFDVRLDRVSVKATTTEALGFVGRKEGIAAQAVLLLENDE